MNQKKDFIAVFDSGVGGISVLKHLLCQMPGERFLYFGDSANAPYGSRSPQEVQNLSLQAAEHLISRGVKAIVVACNTAAAAALSLLRETYPDLIIVGIEPAIHPAAVRHPHGTVGVLATEVTLQGEKFHHLSDLHSQDCTIIKLPAPGLADLVEAGKANSPEAESLLRPILAPWVGKLDALVLGCTHYPFVTAAIRKILGDRVELFDGGDGTARQTRRRLADAGLLSEGAGELVWENSLGTPEIFALCEKLLNSKND